MELHRRQFVINRNPGPDRWETLPLPGDLFLHHHPDLRRSQLRDREGGLWYLLGTAVPAAADTPLAEEVSQAATSEVWTCSDGWAGRWVLIGDGAVGLDAAGMLGLYYNPQTREAGSSPEFLTRGAPTHTVREEDRLNWYPPPFSRFAGLLRLLPSQRLSLASFTPQPRPLLVPLPVRSFGETLEELEAVLKRTVRHMAGLGRVALPLTGGCDSRLILSLLVATGIRPETYTLEHFAGMSRADRTLPPRLAALLGLNHAFVRRPPAVRYPEAYGWYAAQSGGHAVEQDRHYLAYGQLDHLTDGHVILHGGGFEVGRTFYYRRLPADRKSGRRFSFFEPLPPGAREALRHYEAWAELHPEEMDWRDRFYWEQRLGGWIAACGLATDMLPGLRLAPANCRYTMSLLLSLPLAVRGGSLHHADLVARLTPELAPFPFNPREPLLHYLGSLPRRLLRRIRRLAAAP